MAQSRTSTSAELRGEDAGGISEITILPDGRLYVLGLSEAVWEMLDGAGPWGGLSPDRGPRRSSEWKEEREENGE